MKDMIDHLVVLLLCLMGIASPIVAVLEQDIIYAIFGVVCLILARVMTLEQELK